MIANRVKFVLTKFNEYFLSKYIYDQDEIETKTNNDEISIDFINDIFLNIITNICKYSAIELLNDFEHIKTYHMNTDEDREYFKNCKQNIDDYCIHALDI